MSSDSKIINNLFRTALLIRMAEEKIIEEYPKREMRSPTHLYIGEEAIASGVCENLKPSDQLFAYYRSHGWYLAKGGNIQAMYDELYGKQSGCSGGYGGSMHLIDLSAGFQGTTAVVAGAQPHACGAAWALKDRGGDEVVVCAFGDGATEEGLFQESLMFAALRKLPVIFVCENNGLATNTWIAERQPNVPIFERARSFGVAAEQIDGNDAVAVYEASKRAVERARKGEGPTFLECKTYRLMEHCGTGFDYSLGFRTKEEVDSWMAKDPLVKLEALIDKNVAAKLRSEIQSKLNDIIARARAAQITDKPIPEGYVCHQ